MLTRTFKSLALTACLALPALSQAPAAKPAPAPKAAADPGLLASLMDKARTCLGVPYRRGGTTPRGFDCSGFVRFVFASVGIDLDRSSASQAQQGDPIDLAHLQPGDLLFFSTRGMRRGISHVGIYIGEGKFIHASNWGRKGQQGGVRFAQLASRYFADRVVSARRVVTGFTLDLPKDTPAED